MPDELKIVALGPQEEIQGLRSIGVQPVPVESGSDLPEALSRHALDPDVKLVLVSESVAGEASRLVADLRRRSRAPIILIPSHRGPAGMALDWMKRGMEHHIGVDMITKK